MYFLCFLYFFTFFAKPVDKFCNRVYNKKYTKEVIGLKFRKIACFALAMVAVFTISSCKKAEKEREKAVVDTNDDYIQHLKIEDYDGYNFRILTRKDMIDNQYIEEETGDIINDAVYRRNETVKALFNIDITAIESVSTTADDAISSILAGDDQYDIILPHARTAFSYAIQNTLVNFHEVDTIHLDKPWWSKDIVDSCSVNGHLYVLDGDISTHRLYYSYALFFNKTIFDELGLEYPYEMVLDGEWTFDEMKKIAKKGSKDLSGDGIMHPDVDQYGYYGVDWYGPIAVLYTGGQRIYTKDARGVPKLTLNSAKTVDIFAEYFDLLMSDDAYLKKESVSIASDPFREGRALIAEKCLGEAQSLRNMSDDFGILPYPKFSDDDEYTTIIGGGSSLVVMPVTVEDISRTGNITEALCAIGSRDVIPAFYEISLKTKFSRDAESEAMVDIIKDSLIYDLGYISGGTFQSAGRDLAQLNNPDFSSYYAANESQAIIKLQEFNRSYGKIG